MPGWLKAGLIGAAILIILNLLNFIPYLFCIILPITLLVYLVIGAMAASYMPPVRDTGRAAGQGALAALIAALVSGVIDFFIGLARTAAIRMPGFGQIPPEILRQLEANGINPNQFFSAGGLLLAAVFGLVCFSLVVLVAAALGAIGGAIYAGLKAE